MNTLIDKLTAGLFAHSVYPLLLACALGLLIGASIGRLWTLTSARRINGKLQEQVRSLQRESTQLGEERDSARLLGERQRELADDAERRAEAAAAQQEALRVHSQLQAQRLQILEAEVQANEERLICLQGDLVHQRRGGTNEGKKSGSATIFTQDGDDTVPVLNKRVDGDTTDSARPLIDEELESPAPVETRLPASIDALEFELADDADDYAPRD